MDVILCSTHTNDITSRGFYQLTDVLVQTRQMFFLD